MIRNGAPPQTPLGTLSPDPIIMNKKDADDAIGVLCFLTSSFPVYFSIGRRRFKEAANSGVRSHILGELCRMLPEGNGCGHCPPPRAQRNITEDKTIKRGCKKIPISPIKQNRNNKRHRPLSQSVPWNHITAPAVLPMSCSCRPRSAPCNTSISAAHPPR